MKTKKIISLILAVVTLMSVFTISASALSINTKYPTKNITGYILSTSNKTAVAYSNSSCTNSIGYIYANDDCTIRAIYTNGVVKVKCPWTGYSSGRVVYTKLSYFFQNTSSVSTKTATVKTKCYSCYSKSNLSTSLGYVYAGDKCYVIGTSGNYYQVLCPWTGGGYQICWVNKSAFGSSGSSSSINTKYPTKNITGYILSTSNKTAVAYSNSSCTNTQSFHISSRIHLPCQPRQQR